MTTPELLKAARKRIEDPARWTQGAVARTADGEITLSWARDAVSWCAVGAVCAEQQIGRESKAFRKLNRISKRLGYGTACINGTANVTLLNDQSDHATVLKMFDLAIEAEAAK